MITPQLIQQIMDSKEDANADYIYSKLREVEDIKVSITRLENERITERNRHTQAIKEINLKVKAIQEKCCHWTRTYHPDPSGNNDSYHTCDICGIES